MSRLFYFLVYWITLLTSSASLKLLGWKLPNLGFLQVVQVVERVASIPARLQYLDVAGGANKLSRANVNLEEEMELLERGIRVRKAQPILRLHQVGKKVVASLPDAALLGVLVLVSNELIKRQYTTTSDVLPTYLRDLANSTLVELDGKLEMLSSMEWNVDPFIKGEIGALQAQQMELVDLVDKYLVKDILPRIDKELSPFLSTLITDPNQVKSVVKSVKSLVELSTLLLLRPNEVGFEGWEAFGIDKALGDDKTVSRMIEDAANTIIDTIDSAGAQVEGMANDWNKVIKNTAGLLKKKSVLSSLTDVLKFTRVTSSATTTATDTTVLLNDENDFAALENEDR